MAMKAALLMLAMTATLAGSAARAQDSASAQDAVRLGDSLDQKLAAERSAMTEKLQEAQAKLALQQSVMTARMEPLQAKLAAQQGLLEARLRPMEAQMAVQQSLMTARLAMLAPMEAKIAVNESLMMAELEPLQILGMEMQPGAVVTVGQVKDDLFGDTGKFANGASDVTEINLDPNSMSIVGQDRGRDGSLARRMKTMVIHTYKYDHPGMYRMEDVEAYRKKLEDGSWNCSIHVRNKNGSTDICSRPAADHESNEMVIVTAGPQELTFIHMKGNMSLGDLDSMSSSMEELSRSKAKVMRPGPTPKATVAPCDPARSVCEPAAPAPPSPPSGH
jgi:hypothetical protein